MKLAIISAVATVCCCVHAENRYFLYTRNNPSVPQEITEENHIWDSNFNRLNNTIILIHGHRGSARTLFNTLITDNILRYQEPHNVIVVDWEKEASYKYSVASVRVPFVAQDLEYFLRWFTHYSVEMSVHLVGFGLGAHVAGIASRRLSYVVELPRVIIGRITGLDPSGSGWGSNSARLKNTDAQYVEVIYTEGSGLLPTGIGTAIGHVNFYVNGGSNQPGCLTHSCSHNRAYELFAASMYNHNLVGFPHGNPTRLWSYIEAVELHSSTTQMNLNRYRGSALNIGGTELFKRAASNVYRINTRSYPF